MLSTIAAPSRSPLTPARPTAWLLSLWLIIATLSSALPAHQPRQYPATPPSAAHRLPAPAAALGPALLAGDWYVAPTGSDLNDCRAAERPCATIGAALALADAGGRISIAAGTYDENLTLRRDVTLIGAGRATTVIDGGGAGRVVTIEPNVQATIEGVTVQNGAARLDWAFRDGPDLAQGRMSQSATLIAEGVLVAGGSSALGAGTALADAAIFGASEEEWRTVAPMSAARYGHTATRLSDGSVVVIGGRGNGGEPLTSVERYYPDDPSAPDDPPEGRWVDLAPLTEGREFHSAALLHSGEILVFGGQGNSGLLASAAIYSPRDNAWRAAAPLPSGRWLGGAILLDNGDVLAFGGAVSGIGLWTAESLRYDPAADTWTPTGPMGTVRQFFDASLLHDGRVLAAGGWPAGSSLALASAEIFDPVTNTWAPAPAMSAGRGMFSLTTLSNGEVLAAGGSDQSVVAGGEIYSPRSNSWRPAGDMLTPRFEHTATQYASGQVLFIGGRNTSGASAPGLAEVERYSFASANLTEYGAGIAVGNAAALTLRDSAVRDNHADIYAGGIWNQGTLTLERSLVAENSALSYAGVGTYQGVVRLIDSAVRDNRSSGGVAGIGSVRGEISLLRSQVNDNRVETRLACCGGGAGIVTDGLLTVEESEVSGNRWGGNWGQNHTGGIFLYSSAGRLEMRESRVSNNQVISASGWSSLAGGIYLNPQEGPPSAEIVDSEISGNLALTRAIGSAAGGGGIVVGAGTLVLRNTDVLSNTTRNPFGGGGGAGISNDGRLEIYGGAISGNRAEGGSAGGLYSTGTAIVSDTLIADNQADFGGGGGVADSDRARTTILGGAIRGNRAHQGGGIASSGTLTLTGTLIAGNRALDGQPGVTQGGGLWIGSQATVSGATIRDNQSQGEGGGIALASAGARLTLRASEVLSNTAGLNGGGIAARADTRLAVDGGTIASNTSAGYGGGLSQAGVATVEGVSITDNISESGGGGAHNNGTLTIADSQIRANRLENPEGDGDWGGEREFGGGIYSEVNSRLSVIRSTISGHEVGGDPGFSVGGGIYMQQGSTLDLVGSQISDNSALGNGAGLYTDGDTRTTITGSTFSGNELIDPGAAGCPSGNCNNGAAISGAGVYTLTNTTISGNRSALRAGGIFWQFASATLTNVTLTDNEAPQGGALWRSGDTTLVSLRGSIIAGNRAPGGGANPDCVGGPSSLGGNLFGVGAGCAPGAADQAGTLAAPLDPLLGALDDNGGQTPTHAPYPGSPAIDTVTPCPATDQRGVARPQQERCDSGAVEFESPRVFFRDLDGFNAAAGAPPVLLTFDDLPADSPIDTTTIAGVTLLRGERPAPSAPLIVVRGADTFTPDPWSQYRLPTTSGAQLLSPGGRELSIGPDAARENDDLELRFDPPVAAVGFDIIYQALDPLSYVGVTVYGQGDRVLYANDSIPTRSENSGASGAVFFGVSSPATPITRIVVDEYDSEGGPDSNIGFDTVRIGLPAENLYVAPGGSDANGCRSPDSPCRTLRSAIGRAADGTTINLAAGTYNEFIVVDRSLSIVGADPATTVVRNPRPDGQTSVVRVNPGVTASMANLTLTNGFATSSGGLVNGGDTTLTKLIIRDNVGGANGGGGVYNRAGGRLTLREVTISDNRAETNNGGGVYNEAGGSVTIEDSQIAGNSAPAAGGGIYNLGELTIRASRVEGNSAGSGGGGVASLAGATLLIEATSIISGNQATSVGGGISNSGTLTVRNSRISANQSAGGGGIYNLGELTLSESTVSGNQSAGPGGGIASDNPGSKLTIRASTISANVASNGAAPGKGGGVSTTSETAIVNSTISGNTAVGGGGIWAGEATVTITSSTIVRNTGTDQVGGIYGGDVGQIVLGGSILAENQGGDFADCNGPISSPGGNLIGVRDGCLFAASAGDQLGSAASPLSPLLEPLADNGGPTPTHMLTPGSPAIDAAGGSCAATDQRGAARPAGAGCDSGAVEFRGAIGSGFDHIAGTYGFENRTGVVDPLAFFRDFGVEATTHQITRSEVIDSIEGRDGLDLPITLGQTDLGALLPISITEGLEADDGSGRVLPRPTAWLYEELIVQHVYENVASADYEGAILGGLCAGMSATVAAFQQGAEGFKLSDYGVDQVRALELQPDDRNGLLDLIQKYQGRQVSAEVLNYLAEQGAQSPRDLYRDLLTKLGSTTWWQQPAVIGMFQGSGCDDLEVGHAVLPYKLEPGPGQTAKIYVYDSNYPPQPGEPERAIEVDLAANTWSYQISPRKRWTGTQLFVTPLRLFLASPTLPYLDRGSVIAVAGGNRGIYGGNRGIYGGNRGIYGGNRGIYGEYDNGTRTGCALTPDGLRYYEEISRSWRLRPLGGALPNALYFPHSDDQAITFRSIADTDEPSSLFVFGPGGAMGYLADSPVGTTLSARVDPTFSSLTLSSDGPEVTLSAFQMQERADGQETRFVAVSNLPVGSDGAPTFAVVKDEDNNVVSVVVANPTGRPLPVTIGLGAVGAEVVATRSYPDVIEPGEVRTYEPERWEDLEDTPIDVEARPLSPSSSTGPIARYLFNEGEGATIHDTARYAQPVDLQLRSAGAGRWWPDGLEARAANVASSGPAAARLGEAIGASQSFALEALLTPSSARAQGGQALVASLGASSPDVALYQEARAGEVRFVGQVRLSVGGAQQLFRLASPFRPRGGGPTHLVFSRDTGGELTLFVDGALAARAQPAGSLAGWGPGSLRLAAAGGGAAPWRGTFHRLALYDRALGAGEVRALVPRLRSDRLNLATSRGRLSSFDLHGATLRGDAYISLAPTPDVRRVSFWLGRRAGAPVRTEYQGFYDLAGTAGGRPRPFDTTRLANGEHTLHAVIYRRDGTTQHLQATFTVKN